MRNLAKHLVFTAVLAAIPASTLLAQNTNYDQRHNINDRRHDEQSRIRQGERSGQITRGGAARLEAHQHAIHQQERADRAANGGRLTGRERHQLARKQNRQSARVYRDKHNAITQPGVPPR